MKKFIAFLLATAASAPAAVTDVYIAQRDGAATFAYRIITGSSNTGEVLSFDGSGVLVSSARGVPLVSDGEALGSATKMWSDLFLASGAVVNFNNGDVTMTHSANTLAVAGGDLTVADAVRAGDLFAVDVIELGESAATSGVLHFHNAGTAFKGIFTPSAFAADRTYTLPDVSGTMTVSSAALTTTRVPYATTGGALTDEAALAYDAGTNTLTAGTFSGAGGGVTLDASGFNGNLAVTDNTLQEVAQKLDDLTAAGGTNLNDIGDATADGSVAQAGFEMDFTSTLDSAGKAIWTITNTDADTAADTAMIDLRHNDGADANVFYLRAIGDNDGTPTTDFSLSQTAFAIGSGVATTFSGNVTGTATWDLSAATVTLGTITTLPVTNIELGHASANTLTAASGVLSVEGVAQYSSLTKADALEAALFAADAGANDTYAITLSPAITAYVTGAHYRFMANTANTGACTININTVGAKSIKKAAGGITTDPADNDIRSGQWVDLVYDGTNMQMQSTLGNAAAGGSVATDAIFDAAGDLVVGTGANTAARLAVGGFGDHFVTDGATPQWLSRRKWVTIIDYEFTHGGNNYFPTATNAFFIDTIDATAPGVMLINSINATGCVSTDEGMMTFGGGAVHYAARIYMTRLAVSGDNTYKIGFGDVVDGTAFTDGVWFEYTDNVNSGNWVAKCKAGATSGSQNMSVGPAATTWAWLTIDINAGGTEATFAVNGANSVTVTTANSIPNSASELVGVNITGVSTDADTNQLYVDYLGVEQLMTSNR